MARTQCGTKSTKFEFNEKIIGLDCVKIDYNNYKVDLPRLNETLKFGFCFEVTGIVKSIAHKYHTFLLTLSDKYENENEVYNLCCSVHKPTTPHVKEISKI